MLIYIHLLFRPKETWENIFPSISWLFHLTIPQSPKFQLRFCIRALSHTLCRNGAVGILTYSLGCPRKVLSFQPYHTAALTRSVAHGLEKAEQRQKPPSSSGTEAPQALSATFCSKPIADGTSHKTQRCVFPEEQVRTSLCNALPPQFVSHPPLQPAKLLHFCTSSQQGLHFQ